MILLVWLVSAMASPTAICADVADRIHEASVSTDEVVALIRKDDRAYSPDVLACLCVLGAAPEIQREARRHMLRDTVSALAARWGISTHDPMTTPAFQVSTLLAHRLDVGASRPVPFVVLPTRVTAPTWFDLQAVAQSIRDFEVAGARLPPKGWLEDQGVVDLPTGPLPALADDGELARADLSPLLGTYDRALWIDVGPSEEGATRLSWSLVKLSARRPYEVVSADSVQLEEVEAPLVEDCAAPLPSSRRRWGARLAWPPAKIGATVAGGVLAAVFGGLAAGEWSSFQGADPGDPSNAARISRNIAFGTVGIAGGVTALLGFSIPAPIWR